MIKFDEHIFMGWNHQLVVHIGTVLPTNRIYTTDLWCNLQWQVCETVFFVSPSLHWSHLYICFVEFMLFILSWVKVKGEELLASKENDNYIHHNIKVHIIAYGYALADSLFRVLV